MGVNGQVRTHGHHVSNRIVIKRRAGKALFVRVREVIVNLLGEPSWVVDGKILLDDWQWVPAWLLRLGG